MKKRIFSQQDEDEPRQVNAEEKAMRPTRQHCCPSLWSDSSSRNGGNDNNAAEADNAEVVRFSFEDKKSMIEMLSNKTSYKKAVVSQLILPLRYTFDSIDQLESFKIRLFDNIKEMLVSGNIKKESVKIFADEAAISDHSITPAGRHR